MHRVVVVGASLAGVSAVEGLRDAGYVDDIVLVGAEEHLPYERPALSKGALRGETDLDILALRSPDWYRDVGIDPRLGRRATSLDPHSRELLLDDGSAMVYDGLVLATGATPRTMAGVSDVDGVHVLRSFEDCCALRERLQPGARTAVIGAGFIGLEVAATAATLGVEALILETAPAPLAGPLGDDVGEWLSARYASQGVTIRCGVGVRRVVRLRDHFVLELDDDSRVVADVVVAALGVRPTTDWLAGSGVALADGVLCDEFCQTRVPNVVAAGDVCRWYNPLFDEVMRVEHWTNAVEQGRVAAAALVGDRSAPYAAVPYFWSDQFGARIRFVGRSYAADQVVLKHLSEDAIVALYRRDGVIRGALCVNAPKALALYRRQISERVAWTDAVAV